MVITRTAGQRWAEETQEHGSLLRPCSACAGLSPEWDGATWLEHTLLFGPTRDTSTVIAKHTWRNIQYYFINIRQRDRLWSWPWVMVFPTPTGCLAMANSWAPLGREWSLVQSYLVHRSEVEIHWVTHMIAILLNSQERNSSETGRLCSIIMATSNWNGAGPLISSCSSSSLRDTRLFNLCVEKTETTEQTHFIQQNFSAAKRVLLATLCWWPFLRAAFGWRRFFSCSSLWLQVFWDVFIAI